MKISLITTICIVLLLSSYVFGYYHGKKSNDDFQRNIGSLQTKTEITKKMMPIFGRINKTDYKDGVLLYEIKETGVYAVKVDGIMTVKISE